MAGREQEQLVEERVLDLIGRLPVPAGVHDPDGRIVMLNSEFTRLFGYQREDLATLDAWWEAAYPDADERARVRARWTADMHRSTRTGQGLRPELYQVRGKNGTKHEVEISAFSAGPYVVAIFIDRTEIRAAAHRLRQEAKFREEVIRNAAAGVCVCHDIPNPPYVRFTVWNECMRELTGYSMEEINRRGWYQTVYPEPELSRRAEERMARMRTGDDLRAEEWEITRADGEKRLVTISTSVLDLKEQGTHVLAVIDDVTERRRAEEQRLVLERQLQHAQRLESLGVLAGGVAHDFNNLLVAVLTNAELGAKMPGLCATARTYFDDIRAAALRGADLTRAMLAYAGEGRMLKRAVDLRELVRETGSLLRVALPKSVELVFDMPQPVAIWADDTQIRQLVMNLISNAAEASAGADRREGWVRVALKTLEARNAISDLDLDQALPPGRYVLLQVEDNGVGMSDDTLQHIFEPFFTTKFAGRGLGLAAAQGIVRSHDGGIRVTSRPGHGSLFEVYLPESPVAPTEEGTVPRTAPARPAPRARVLLVDDDDQVRRAAHAVLENAGYEVLEAATGGEAIAFLEHETRPVDVVLLDMVMPGMDGPATARALQERGFAVPIIAMSGTESRQTFPGARGALSKPFTVERLVEAVREAVTRG